MKETEEFYAWAIDSRSDEGHGLIGRYWWFNQVASVIPKHLEGCKIAAFTTRKLARQGLLSVKRAFPNARVIRVKVTIQAVVNETTSN